MREDFGEGPALEFGERASLGDANAVTDFGLAAFVVDVVFFRAFDDFVKAWVRDPCDVFDDEGFVHFIRDDHANAGLADVDGGFW